MLNDTSVASAGSYIRTCRRIRNSKKIATIRDFHQNICVNSTINFYEIGGGGLPLNTYLLLFQLRSDFSCLKKKLTFACWTYGSFIWRWSHWCELWECLFFHLTGLFFSMHAEICKYFVEAYNTDFLCANRPLQAKQRTSGYTTRFKGLTRIDLQSLIDILRLISLKTSNFEIVYVTST